MVREFKTFTTAANRHLLKTNFPPCTSSRGSISKAGWEHFLFWIGDFPIKMAKINVFTLQPVVVQCLKIILIITLRT